MFSLSAAVFVPNMTTNTVNNIQTDTYAAHHVCKKMRNNEMTAKEKSLYKTELCNNWIEVGFCRYENQCRYAHGYSELVARDDNMKRKKNCKSFMKD